MRCVASRRPSAASHRSPPRGRMGPWFQTGQPNVVPLAEELSITDGAAQTPAHRCPRSRRRCTSCRAAPTPGARRPRRERSDGVPRTWPRTARLLQPVALRVLHARCSRARSRRACCSGDRRARSSTRRSSAAPGRSASPRSRWPSSTSRLLQQRTSTRRSCARPSTLGADGWMEDFGESTPPFLVTQHDGTLR